MQPRNPINGLLAPQGLVQPLTAYQTRFVLPQTSDASWEGPFISPLHMFTQRTDESGKQKYVFQPATCLYITLRGPCAVRRFVYFALPRRRDSRALQRRRRARRHPSSTEAGTPTSTHTIPLLLSRIPLASQSSSKSKTSAG
jgi:hypothetical protein